MGKIIETRITRFDGGLSEDKRVKDFSKFSLTKHFDTFTYPRKLVPYHKTIADETKAYKIVKFLYAPLGSEMVLYGLGVIGGASPTHAKLFTYNDLADFEDGWVVMTNGESTVTARNTDVLFYYKDYVYLFSGGTHLQRQDTGDVSAMESGYQTIAYNYDILAQPVHHPSDDCAYFFADNIVYRLDNVTWDGAVLTLPTNLNIVSACPYGNYLAIGCVDGGDIGVFKKSIVFLWDRDSSLTTLTERIDLGEGTLKHLANLNNKLIAIMNCNTDNVASLNKGRIVVKQVSGNFGVVLNELTTDDIQTDAMANTKVVKNNKIYFPARADLNGDSRFGIWVVDEDGRMALDFIEAEATSYEGISTIANMWWIAHSADGSVNHSDQDAGYSTTSPSIYESLIFNASDSDLTKKLIGVATTFEKLPTAGQVVLKYRIDGATTWTTIYTYTTDSGISHGAVNIEATGVNLLEYKEVEFRIESTGGAVITGLKFKEKIVDKQLF